MLLGFYRQHQKTYLLHWALGWTALSLFHLFTGLAAGMSLHMHLAPIHPLRVVAAVAGGVAGYLQIGWMAFGTYELIRRRPVRLVEAKRILAGLIAAGAVLAFAFLGSGSAPLNRYLARIALHDSISAIVFVICAIALWRSRGRGAGIGFSILSAALIGYAIGDVVSVGVGIARLARGDASPFSVYASYLEFLLQSILAVGMIACLLEDEREASDLAAVQIEHLAYHDALTGLPNRPLFVDRLIVALAQASRADQQLAVFFLDLDRFKDINDSLGHTVGDNLLKSVAERVRRCVREGDTVARFGGDEFTLLIPRIDHIEDAAKIAQKINETLKIPFVVGDRELFVTTSIGISIFPGDGADPETLVRNADSAMYRAKDQGRDNYQLYAPAMNAQALEKLALENTLRKALSQEELVLHYQPLVSASTGRIVGLEALVRWQHPDRGLLGPAHFISAAESSGLIVPIGEWILNAACRQVRVLRRKDNLDISVAVNLSARQFQQPNLVDQIRSIVHETGIEPEWLELEITESNAMQNAENAIHTLRELKNLGVRISMDDFGTGYSSLNYLKRFPIDTLKLDQMFVRDVTTDRSDAAIVTAVISLAHSLDLKVVAEGVETEEQRNFLIEKGCDILQGYLFSRPKQIAELNLGA